MTAPTKEELHDLARQIAAELTGWEYDEKAAHDTADERGSWCNPPGPQLLGWATLRTIGPRNLAAWDAGGMKPALHIGLEYPSSQHRKVSVAGLFELKDSAGEHWTAEKESRTSIGASFDRGAVAIAKEINRRLLPDYLAAWDAEVGRLAEHNAYLASRGSARERLACILGNLAEPQDRPHYGNGSPDVIQLRYRLDGAYGEIDPGTTYARFELRSVPLDLAEQLCTVIAGYTGGA